MNFPVGSNGRNSAGWWGVLCLIATEAALFSYLLFSYYYLAVQYGPSWSPEPHPKLALALPNTVILLSSSVAVWWGERGLKRGRRGQHLVGYGLAIALGIIFVVVQLFEWKAKSFSIRSGAYGSLYFTVTGFHMLHVVVGLVCSRWCWGGAPWATSPRAVAPPCWFRPPTGISWTPCGSRSSPASTSRPIYGEPLESLIERLGSPLPSSRRH